VITAVIILGMKRKCPMCGTRFYPVQPTQTYCRPYCRLKAFRQRRQKKKEAEGGRIRSPSR
jgi:predicted nucleic acid-binding Zn ribbon protein